MTAEVLQIRTASPAKVIVQSITICETLTCPRLGLNLAKKHIFNKNLRPLSGLEPLAPFFPLFALGLFVTSKKPPPPWKPKQLYVPLRV